MYQQLNFSFLFFDPLVTVLFQISYANCEEGRCDDESQKFANTKNKSRSFGSLAGYWWAVWLVGTLSDWLTEWLAGWLIGLLADWLAESLAGWWADGLAGWLGAGWLDDLLNGWLAADWTAGWLADWLIG